MVQFHFILADAKPSVLVTSKATRQGTSLVLTCFMERGVPLWLGECHEAHCHRDCTKNFAVDMYAPRIMGIFDTQNKFIYIYM